MAPRKAAEVDNNTVKNEEVVINNTPIIDPIEIEVESEGLDFIPPDDSPLRQDPPKPPKNENGEDRNVLLQQLQEMRDAEQSARQRAQQAETLLAKERADKAVEIKQYRDDTAQAEYESVVNALGAAQSALESAKHELQSAGTDQDWGRVAEANEKIGRFSSELRDLERIKENIEYKREREQKTAPEPSVRQQQAPENQFEAAIAQLPDNAKNWLRAHPEYITDQRKNRKIQFLHDESQDKDIVPFSKSYFDFIETSLGLKSNEEDNNTQEPKRNVVASAPVSRETQSMTTGKPRSTKVTLTAEEREIARNSGITEVEYAQNKLILAERKKNGYYQH